MIRIVGRKDGEAGSALLEFAIATAVILTLLFGIIDVGRALYAYDWVSDAARRGTRYGMVRGTGSCTGSPELPDCRATAGQISTYVMSNAVGIDPSQVTITPLCWVPASTNFSQPPCTAPNTIKVTVQYRFAFISPFVPMSWTMKSSSIRPMSQ